MTHSLSLSSTLHHSVGVVLSFVTNERSYDSIDSLQETVNGIIDTAVDYMDDIINVCVDTS